MDVVITYVNGNDPVWKQDYERHTHIPIMEKRFRDWGTLKYLLRGIEVNMPFIENVFLVVSHESQVPEWADTENLKVVLHGDIIPQEYLPTFNSTTIEMFLHRIDGLAENYLYFNDDIFPVRKCSPEDFFRDGKGVLGFRKHILSLGMYKKQCRNSDRMARAALGLKNSPVFVRPQHICTPMQRSQCSEAFAKVADKIYPTLSALRTNENLNQYFYLDYMYYNGRMIASRLSAKHFSVAVAGADKITSFIANPDTTFCCINDVSLSDDKFVQMRDKIVAAFEERFGSKSRFEK